MRTQLLAAVAALMLAHPAAAAIVTRTYSFAVGSGAGTGPVTGSVTVRFDPAVTALDRPGAVVNSASLPYRAPVSYSYQSAQDTLAIVSADYSPAGRGGQGFALTIRNASSEGPLGGTLSYAPGGGSNLLTRTIAVTPTTPSARLPEPATWAMLVLGFGGIGWLARRHQRRSEAAFTERLRRIAAGEID
jgi:hypothetical protein